MTARPVDDDLIQRARGLLDATAPGETPTVAELICLRGLLADLLAEVGRLRAELGAAVARGGDDV